MELQPALAPRRDPSENDSISPEPSTSGRTAPFSVTFCARNTRPSSLGASALLSPPGPGCGRRPGPATVCRGSRRHGAQRTRASRRRPEHRRLLPSYRAQVTSPHGHHGGHAFGHDAACGNRHRLQARCAKPAGHHARHRQGQARTQRGLAADVLTGDALGIAAAHHHLLDRLELERVTVVAVAARHEPVVGGVVHGAVEDPIHAQHAARLVELVLDPRALRDLDHHVDAAVGEGVRHGRHGATAVTRSHCHQPRRHRRARSRSERPAPTGAPQGNEPRDPGQELVAWGEWSSDASATCRRTCSRSSTT